LPVIGGPADSFQGSSGTSSAGAAAAGGNGRVRETAGRPVTGPPPSAVDQYAALAAAQTRAVPDLSAGAPPTVPPHAGAPVGAAPLPPRPAKVSAVKAIRRPKTAGRSPRRARLQVRHINVWSVLRFSCVLAIALFFVWLIMVGILYGILDVTHVFSKVNDTVRTINGDDNSKDVITPGIVFGGAFIIGLINIVLFIGLSTIGSVVYNLCADLVGGVEVTLAEHD